MKIVADENIPLVEYYFQAYGEVLLKPGRDIQAEDVVNADILLVRSVTPVNQALLQNSTVTFVGSATIGCDHIDTNWLKQAGIQWAIAKGCNAVAVVEYVLSVVAALQRAGRLGEKKLRAGVIGVGDIGARVVSQLTLLGFDVLLHDPIRAAQDENFVSVPLTEFRDLDFISLHTPLTFYGEYPTYHMIAKKFFQQQKKNGILLNTSRGSVIDFSALKQYGSHLIWCLDVWENEPIIDLDILQATEIATPHIAGYSVQGKYRGIEMIYQAAVRQKIIPDLHIPPIVYPRKSLGFSEEKKSWQDILLQIYDPLITSREMKEALLHQTATFDDLRKGFVDRYETAYIDGAEFYLTMLV